MARIIRDSETSTRLEGTPKLDTYAHTLYVGPDTSWIAGPSGERHRLGRSLRLIVDALVARHRNAGPPLTVAELLEAGWPGERPIAQAGANRVHVEMNRLRNMGLRDILECPGDGYRLAPQTRVVFEKKPGITTRMVDRVRRT